MHDLCLDTDNREPLPHDVRIVGKSLLRLLESTGELAPSLGSALGFWETRIEGVLQLTAMPVESMSEEEYD